MPVVLVTLFIAALLPILRAAAGHYFRIRQFGAVDNDPAQPRLCRPMSSDNTY